MTAKLVRLETRHEREKREDAQSLAASLLEFAQDGVHPRLRSTLLTARAALQRVAHPEQREGLWPGGFCMISREECGKVWDWIRQLPPEARPHLVRDVFFQVLLHLDHDTGEVLLTRDELAEKAGCAARHVSEVMGTLEQGKIIRRERRRVPGMQGRGVAVYFINPHVAWNGHLEGRKEQASKTAPPLLSIMEGGKR